MIANGLDSPTSVDAPLEYLTVENYNWPKPPPPKRARLAEEERRRRHSECQRRFLARKQRDFKQLRQDVANFELQLKLLQAMQETRALISEQQQLTSQLMLGADEFTQSKPATATPKAITSAACEDVEAIVEQVVESLDVDELVAELGLP